VIFFINTLYQKRYTLSREIFLSIGYQIYITDYQSIKELKADISKYIDFYNFNRFHSSLGYQKPMNVYLNEIQKIA